MQAGSFKMLDFFINLGIFALSMLVIHFILKFLPEEEEKHDRSETL